MNTPLCATCGLTKRHLNHEGSRYAHTFDPVTPLPNTDAWDWPEWARRIERLEARVLELMGLAVIGKAEPPPACYECGDDGRCDCAPPADPFRDHVPPQVLLAEAVVVIRECANVLDDTDARRAARAFLGRYASETTP